MSSKKVVIETIAAKDLGIDDRVQRLAEPSQIKYLYREWRDESVGVSRVWITEEGKKVLLDGQQRWRTQMEEFGNPDYEFTCQVYYGFTEVEAAQIFLDANKSKNVGLYPKWRIGVLKGDDIDVLIKRSLSDAGVMPSPRNKWGTPPSTNNFSVMRRVISLKNGNTYADNAEAVTWAYKVYQEAWDSPILKQPPFRSEVIEGLAMFYLTYGPMGATDKVLLKKIKKLQASGNGTIMEFMGAAKAKSVGSNRVAPQMVDVLFDVYNSGRGPKLAAA